MEMEKMKTYTKIFNACNHCPNIAYLHFDGEGESSPLEFNRPVCTVTDELWNIKKYIMGKYYDDERFMARNIPDKNSIPEWCPLADKNIKEETNGNLASK